LRIILEQAKEWQNDVNIGFDFDTVNREQMWTILRLYGIPIKMTHMIKLFYNDYNARAEHGGKYTDLINIGSGVKQGCVMSPTLFVIIIQDWIMKKVTDNRTGITWKL
jgi:hypothetical protein